MTTHQKLKVASALTIFASIPSCAAGTAIDSTLIVMLGVVMFLGGLCVFVGARFFDKA